MSLKILGQYKDGQEAVTHALKLVLGYVHRVCSQESRETIASTYTPNVLTRIKKRKSAIALCVFDIDDTLIFDNHGDESKPKKHQIVIDLLMRLREVGAHIHLITARINDDDMRKETITELELMNIPYNSLTLAPQFARNNMASVSKWKMQTRRNIGAIAKSPIALTVGDQWGDMVVLPDDDQITKLDSTYKTTTSPYIVLRPSDNVSLWGLKLQAHDD